MSRRPAKDLRCGVSYLANRYFPRVKEDLAHIAEICDYVVHTYSETDLYYHRVVMEQIFKESRRRGLEVWADPWGLGGVFGGEAFSKFLLDHRRAWQFLSTGYSVQAACLNNLDFRNFVKEWILQVCDSGAQVIFWDEPHLSLNLDWEIRDIFSCSCNHCRELFHQEYGETMPSKTSSLVRDFRRRTLRWFLEEMIAFAHKKGLRNALTIYAWKGIAEYELLWEEAVNIPGLDIFGCDPYWRWGGRRARDPYIHVGDFARRVVNSCRRSGKEPHLWIQAMNLPKGRESEIIVAVEAAYSLGVHNLAAWSYDGGAILDGLFSERPDYVWKNVCRAFQKIRRQAGVTK